MPILGKLFDCLEGDKSILCGDSTWGLIIAGHEATLVCYLQRGPDSWERLDERRTSKYSIGLDGAWKEAFEWLKELINERENS